MDSLSSVTRTLAATAVIALAYRVDVVTTVIANESVSFKRSDCFDERTCTIRLESQIRLHVNKPWDGKAAERTRVLLYALPNGNTIEWTLGCRMAADLDWHYDIQHVAAQARLIRSLDSTERLVLVCAEANGRSWPAWRKTRADANAQILGLLEQWRQQFGGEDAVVTLAGHSGGGSFMFGVIEAAAEIPPWIDRIAFLDANYSFAAAAHANKLQQWLQGQESRRLIVVAYDDRRITFNGKPVVGPEGGTYRATQRMYSALRDYFPITKREQPPFVEYAGLENRLRFYVHSNPHNKILHTALVGDMNGLVHVQTLGTRVKSAWGSFGGPRAYTDWIQPSPELFSMALPESPGEQRTARKNRAPVGHPGSLTAQGSITEAHVQPAPHNPSSVVSSLLPPRPAGAVGGTAFMQRVQGLSWDEREAMALKQIASGNFPDLLRDLQRVPLSGKLSDGTELNAVMEVMPDYLAVGSDTDFVRLPLTPRTAQSIADRLGCVLPTRKMVDAIDGHATIHLQPHPLTEDRESVTTFLQHHEIIESQLVDHKTRGLITGIKKDVVLSPRIFERPERLALYGWRRLDGRPIQNLTIVHWDQYVDYSHGIRLVKDTLEIGGQPFRIAELLQDPLRHVLVSDEGPMNPPRYPVDD